MFDLTTFKKQFDRWEDGTARYLEHFLRSPLFLGPSGALLSAYMRMKAARDDARNKALGEVGFATKHDQERMLHLLNQLQSRIMDLEEQLEDLRNERR